MFSSVQFVTLLKQNILRGLLEQVGFKPSPNCPRPISGDRKWAGSEFQTAGAATVKLRRLSFVVLVLGTNKSPRSTQPKYNVQQYGYFQIANAV